MAAIKTYSHCVGKSLLLNQLLCFEQPLLLFRNRGNRIDPPVEEIGIFLVDVSVQDPVNGVKCCPCHVSRLICISITGRFRFCISLSVIRIFLQNKFFFISDRIDIVGSVSGRGVPVRRHVTVEILPDLFAEGQKGPGCTGSCKVRIGGRQFHHKRPVIRCVYLKGGYVAVQDIFIAGNVLCQLAAVQCFRRSVSCPSEK